MGELYIDNASPEIAQVFADLIQEKVSLLPAEGGSPGSVCLYVIKNFGPNTHDLFAIMGHLERGTDVVVVVRNLDEDRPYDASLYRRAYTCPVVGPIVGRGVNLMATADVLARLQEAVVRMPTPVLYYVDPDFRDGIGALFDRGADAIATFLHCPVTKTLPWLIKGAKIIFSTMGERREVVGVPWFVSATGLSHVEDLKKRGASVFVVEVRPQFFPELAKRQPVPFDGVARGRQWGCEVVAVTYEPTESGRLRINAPEGVFAKMQAFLYNV